MSGPASYGVGARLTARRYIHACELGGDGNHGLQKKRKHNDPDDASLCEGKGYFVDPAKMKTYLEGIKSEAAVSGLSWRVDLCTPNVELAGDVQWVQGWSCTETRQISTLGGQWGGCHHMHSPCVLPTRRDG